MSLHAPNVRRVVAVALLVGAAWAGIHGVGGEPPRSESALASGKCILCKSYGASHVPRICNSCNNKFSSKCILCSSYGASHTPRICNSCNNKFSSKCILCSSYGASHTPRICNSCNNKH